jgi:hypothetical protein
MAAGPPFTATTLVAAASDVMEGAGYQRVGPDREGEWPGSGARIYEDPYSVVALVVYETWTDLSDSWLEAQAALVELISTHFTRGDAKSWEGYLVLLTPSVVPSDARLDAIAIQRNTTHVRKLLATGDELRSIDDIADALLPLLPLQPDQALAEPRSALDLLPELLARRAISEDSVRVAIQAFLAQQPVIERLHARGANGEQGQG